MTTNELIKVLDAEHPGWRERWVFGTAYSQPELSAILANEREQKYGKRGAPHTHPNGPLCSPDWCGSESRHLPRPLRRSEGEVD